MLIRAIALALTIVLMNAAVAGESHREQVRLLQEALFTLGFYYTARVDGQYGPRTEAAIRAFQSSLGATPTGITTSQQHAHAMVEAARVPRPRVWPMDESDRDPQFAAVRSALLTATLSRDPRGVASFFADDAVLDFGGGRGPDELANRLGDPSTGKYLWWELDVILSMGAIQTDDTTFCMPYVWCAERVARSVASNMTAWIVNRTAALYERPDMESEILEILRYDVLEIQGLEGDWTRVITQQGDVGWLHRSMYRTPHDFRILVSRRDGRWQVTAFVAGD